MSAIQNHLSVLIVDADADRLSSMIELLDLPESQISSARTAQEGFEKAKLGHPYLIISRTNLPDASGIDLCRMVRTDEDLYATQFILIDDSSASPEAALNGFHAGADDYLEASFNRQHLSAKILRVLER